MSALNPLRHGDRRIAEDSTMVCRVCDTRIVTGDEIRWDVRPKRRGGGMRLTPKGRWSHDECWGDLTLR